MATSGSHNFTLNRDQAIKRAFQLVNIYDINSTPDSSDISYANDMLNMMLLFWSGQGIRIWNRKIGYLFLANDDEQYSLSVSGDHATASYVSTTLSAAEALGQTALSVTSSTGMTAGDYVGIELDDGTRQWTTITTVNSSVLITVTASLTAAAASGNTVVSYTTKIPRPMRIIRATNLDLVTHIESTMQSISYDEYFDLPDKTTEGDPNNFFYDKRLSAGVLYVFPRPNDVQKIIAFTYYEQMADLDSATNDIDIPQEWLLPVIYGLAVELAYAYGEFPALQQLEPRAEKMFNTVMYWDSDDESVRMLPE